ncbi:sensor histidine kinase [Actinomadura sp. DC4]|uniref:sensor histidine kinase n=1 Tax=Actinomadura sp. DC4 TaxID=3055069 RepID=UPI0025B0C496|nr:sensor histidine kinase [Actinomadura sp. DC4]MDN3357537.1 sensor histidine kinase [Actinomadura sp. DC4]
MSRLSEVRRAVRRHTLAADGVLAVGLFAMALAAPKVSGGYGVGPLDEPAIAVGALTAGALVLRRRWPRAVLAFTTAGTALYLAIGGGKSPLLFVSMAAVYTVVLGCSRRAGVAVTCATAAILAAAGVAFGGRSLLDNVILTVIAETALAAVAGEVVRGKRSNVAAIRERAHRAERTREEEAARRVMEERLRIARELHDVLAHHIALINVQAGVAAHVMETEPVQAREALAHIRRAGRSALDELRTTVGLLRQPDTRPPDAGWAPEPMPGLDRLPQLIAALTATGLTIEQQVEGEPRELPATVDLAGYRIVQEALTNVRKHAPGAGAVVRLTYLPSELRVRVTDTGTNAPPRADGTGHGLLGMRERALSLGGSFSADAEPGGGFRVTAALPSPAVASPLTLDPA